MTLLCAAPLRADTFVHDELWIDIDVTGACVVIPDHGRHDSPNCEGVDVDAMRLKLATPADLAAVFVGFIPYASGKFYLEVRDARGPSERITADLAAQTARTIRDAMARGANVEHIGEPVTSPVTHEDGVDRLTVTLDFRYAGTNEDVRSTTYVFAGDGSTLVTTMTGVTHAAEVDRAMQPILASVRIPHRAFDLRRLGSFIATYVVPVQIALAIGIVLWGNDRTKKKKKKKDAG